MKTLLLVDIQKDFLPGGALAVPQGDEVIPVANRMMDQFPLVVALQDWHPPSHKSFASNHTGKNPFDTINLNGIDQILWPDHCVQKTQGAEYTPQLDSHKAEVIFRKGIDPEIDSYSGFYDNGYQKSTGLTSYLKGKKVQEVYILGLAGDFCVYFTAMDAIKEGFQATLIMDGIRSINPEDFNRKVAEFQEKGGQIIQSSEVDENTSSN